MYYSEKKKQRGQRRRFIALCRKIDEIVPFADTERTYEHFHVGNCFIEHPKTYSHFKTAFCRKVLEKAEKIIAEKPTDLPFCKLVAAFYPHNLWSSQIIIFYDKDYYDRFMIRNLPEQTWKEIEDKSRSFAKERNIKTNLAEIGYIERFPAWGVMREQELWFYGEIN